MNNEATVYAVCSPPGLDWGGPKMEVLHNVHAIHWTKGEAEEELAFMASQWDLPYPCDYYVLETPLDAITNADELLAEIMRPPSDKDPITVDLNNPEPALSELFEQMMNRDNWREVKPAYIGVPRQPRVYSYNHELRHEPLRYVYVGHQHVPRMWRGGYPLKESVWANPYNKDYRAGEITQLEACEMFQDYVLSSPYLMAEELPKLAEQVLEHRKVLICW